MNSCIRNIRALLKKKEYEKALEVINESISMYDSDDLLFYKAYTLGEMNCNDECIDQYITLIQKNETKEYLQGIIRILDRCESMISGKTIIYFKKLNKYDIPESRLEMNERMILKFYKNNDIMLYENIKDILQNRLNSHEEYEDLKENVLAIANMINIDHINQNIKELFTKNLNKILKNLQENKLDMQDDKNIRVFLEKIYLDYHNENIFKLDFNENLLFKISKNYLLHDKKLTNEIYCDFMILIEYITLNNENHILKSFIYLLKTKIQENKDVKYIKMHHRYLENYFKNYEELEKYFDKNMQAFFVYFYDFYNLEDFVLKKIYNFKDEYIFYAQKYLSSTIQFLQSNFAGDLKHKDCVLRNLRDYFESKQIDEYISYYRSSTVFITETFFYYINFLKYDKAKEEYLSEIHEFFEEISRKYACKIIKNDFISYFDILLKLIETDGFKNEYNKDLFFEYVYDEIWIYKIFSELICYLLMNNLINCANIHLFQRYLKEEYLTGEYIANCFYYKYKITKETKYLSSCIEADPLCYFAVDDYITLNSNNTTELKRFLKKRIDLQNKMIKSKNSNNEILTVYEKDSSYVHHLAKFYTLNNEDRRALNTLEENQRFDHKYHILLGVLYFRFNQLNESEVQLRKANELKESFLVSLTLSKIFYRTNRFNLAISVLEKNSTHKLYLKIEILRLFNKEKLYEQSFNIINEIINHTNNHLINEILNYERLKANTYKFEDTGISEGLSYLNEFKILNHKIENLKLYNESLEQIFNSGNTRITKDTICKNPYIHDQNISHNYLYKSYEYLISKDFDKAKLLLKKAENDYSNHFLYFFFQIIIENKNVIMVYDSLIESYRLKYFELFAYATQLFLKNAIKFDKLDSVIEIYEKANQVTKFTPKCLHTLGKLYLLNGELDKSKKIMEITKFNKIYKTHKDYIDSFIEMRSGNFNEAYRKLSNTNYKDENIEEYKKYIEDKMNEDKNNLNNLM